MVSNQEIAEKLWDMAVNTGTLNCLGCGFEHNCSVHSCAVLKQAAELISQPNEPLTLEQLREMDGEPVWIVEHPDWGHWELSADAEDYIADRDQDLYGLKHDDPAGQCGLHVLGWLAYPEACGHDGVYCADIYRRGRHGPGQLYGQRLHRLGLYPLRAAVRWI